MTVTARAEHVGSLLRPSYLLQARERTGRGQMGAAEFKSTEDRAVSEVVAGQLSAHCPVLTDGELRRDSFQSELAAACAGFDGVNMDAWLHGSWHSDVTGDVSIARPDGLAVVAPLRRRRGISTEEFVFLRAALEQAGAPAGTALKVTLPSPSLYANLWSPDRSRDAYPTLEAYLDDVTRILCDEARELARLGCDYIQLDAPHYPLLIDETWQRFYTSRGWSVASWLAHGIELDNAVIEAGRPATFGFHLCRGNQHSRWLVSGGYDAIAAPVFGQIRADRLLLEYDDERSGGFDPLRLVRDDTIVVLGLVTTKTPRMETPEYLESRIRAAAELIGTERLAVGTQCGFATSLLGNAIGEDDQWRKLAVLTETARRVFGTVS